MPVDILLSFAFHKGTDLGVIKEALGPDQKLMIDSGGFTAHTIGKPIDRADYAAWLKSWEGAWDYAMTLDVIGDPEGTRANLTYLERKGLPVIPIYTASAPFTELEALARDHDYIAYGGLVGVPKNLQIPATAKVVAAATEHGCKVHTLGQTAVPMFRATGAYSGDSSNASLAPLVFAMPIYVPWTHRLERLHFGKTSLWEKYPDLLRAYGLSAQLTMSGDIIRSLTARTVMIRAGVLSIGLLADHLAAGSDRPRVYSAIVSGSDLPGVMNAARDWRTGNLPHPLNRVAS